MIVRYQTSTGDVLGYQSSPSVIPDMSEWPDGISYLRWDGDLDRPVAEYQVVDGQVVLRSDVQTIRDNVKWRSIRGQRDALLSASDYVILPDAPYSDVTKTNYRTYRQALRDLPQTYSNPDDVVWPTKP